MGLMLARHGQRAVQSCTQQNSNTLAWTVATWQIGHGGSVQKSELPDDHFVDSQPASRWHGLRLCAISGPAQRFSTCPLLQRTRCLELILRKESSAWTAWHNVRTDEQSKEGCINAMHSCEIQ